MLVGVLACMRVSQPELPPPSTSLSPPPSSRRGIAGNCIALIYYAAPLSSMWDVIRLRNSASILLPLTIMNTTNAGLWTTYGLAVGDYYVWVPNGIGLLLSVAQLVLRAVFPAKARYHGASGSSTLS